MWEPVLQAGRDNSSLCNVCGVFGLCGLLIPHRQDVKAKCAAHAVGYMTMNDVLSIAKNILSEWRTER